MKITFRKLVKQEVKIKHKLTKGWCNRVLASPFLDSSPERETLRPKRLVTRADTDTDNR